MKLEDLTEREKALLRYFYTVATHPRVSGVGRSFTKISAGVFSCVEEDIVNVLCFALGKTTEWAGGKASILTRGVSKTMLGGVMPEKAAGQIADGLGTLTVDAFSKAGEVIDNWLRKKRK